MNSTLVMLAAIGTFSFAIGHAYFGEKRLIAPLNAMGRGILADDYGRTVLRLAWHFTTTLLILVAAFLFFAATRPAAVDNRMLPITGMAFVGCAVVDCVATKGRHDAWPWLLAIGIVILFA